jgi:virulence-associated protein VagC
MRFSRLHGLTHNEEEHDVHGKGLSKRRQPSRPIAKELRFPEGVAEVAIHRQGDRLILEPLGREKWPKDFWKAFDGMSPDFERPRQKLGSLDS